MTTGVVVSENGVELPKVLGSGVIRATNACRLARADKTMNVRVLYFDDCPNHPLAVELVRSVVAELGIETSVDEVKVTSQEDAERLRFLGSPTIQVDGVDIDPTARSRTDFAISCRRYGSSGVPSRDLLAAALRGDDNCKTGAPLTAGLVP